MWPRGLVGCIKYGGSYHPSDTSRLTPFWNSSSIAWPPLVMGHWRGQGLLLCPCCSWVWAPWKCIIPLGLGYDTWHYYLINFLYPTIAPKKSSFSLLFEEKNGVLILGDWLHMLLWFSHVRMSLRMPYNRSWHFGVRNVSWCLFPPRPTVKWRSYNWYSSLKFGWGNSHLTLVPI